MHQSIIQLFMILILKAPGNQQQKRLQQVNRRKTLKAHSVRTTLGGSYGTPPLCSQDAGFPQFHRGQNPLTEAGLTLGNVSTFATCLCQGFLHCHPPERHIFLCIQNLFHAGLQDSTHTFWGIPLARAKLPRSNLISPFLQKQKHSVAFGIGC